MSASVNIYVASSWRNEYQQDVVLALRKAGHDVYDFKNPTGGADCSGGFRWSELDHRWREWTNEEYVRMLEHDIACAGFFRDYDAMCWADACVMVMPCGPSASMEAGWMQGRGKPTVCYVPAMREPDLMVKLFDLVTTRMDDVIEFLGSIR